MKNRDKQFKARSHHIHAFQNICAPVKNFDEYIPIKENAKYIGMYLDWHLCWKHDITKKKHQIERHMSYKMLLYKSIVKLV